MFLGGKDLMSLGKERGYGAGRGIYMELERRRGRKGPMVQGEDPLCVVCTAEEKLYM